MKLLLALAGVSLLVGVVGCSDDVVPKPSVDTKPSCTAIIEACHPLDKGSGPIHDCHEDAEADGVTEGACATKKGACLATCKSGGGGDAG